MPTLRTSAGTQTPTQRASRPPPDLAQGEGERGERARGRVERSRSAAPAFQVAMALDDDRWTAAREAARTRRHWRASLELDHGAGAGRAGCRNRDAHGT